MARTNAGAVAAVLGRNMIPGTNLAPYIDAASSVVNQVVTKAGAKGLTLDSPTQELIERWLSAHFYQLMDPGYASRSTEGASGAFEGVAKGEGFDATKYGVTAQRLDWTNCLRNLDKVQQASALWLGGCP